jgi:nucleotide-binding universal stress UspA family protein
VTYEIEQQERGHEAPDELLEAAAAHGAKLVVIGIRRRSPVGKLLLGSTAQRIILEAPCPVLAVKPIATPK